MLNLKKSLSSSWRIGMRGRELMGGVGKTMMQSGGTFGTFMSIGMGIRCWGRGAATSSVTLLWDSSNNYSSVTLSTRRLVLSINVQIRQMVFRVDVFLLCDSRIVWISVENRSWQVWKTGRGKSRSVWTVEKSFLDLRMCKQTSWRTWTTNTVSAKWLLIQDDIKLEL